LQNQHLPAAKSSKYYAIDDNNVKCVNGAVCGLNVPPAVGGPFHLVIYVRNGAHMTVDVKAGDAATQNNCNPTVAPTPNPTPPPTVIFDF
jgi:hypothetical protein